MSAIVDSLSLTFPGGPEAFRLARRYQALRRRSSYCSHLREARQNALADLERWIHATQPDNTADIGRAYQQWEESLPWWQRLYMAKFEADMVIGWADAQEKEARDYLAEAQEANDLFGANVMQNVVAFISRRDDAGLLAIFSRDVVVHSLWDEYARRMCAEGNCLEWMEYVL